MAEIKKEARGGKRPGAGRKAHGIKGLLKELPPDTAALILVKIEAQSKWEKLAASKDERIVLDTLKYLTDRAYGKPKQALEVTGDDGGPIEHTHTIRFGDGNRDS